MLTRPVSRMTGLIVMMSVVVAGSFGQPSAEAGTLLQGTKSVSASRHLRADTQDCAVQSILPAYFYPGATWQTALATATSSSTIVVNPDSGPGSSFDPQYAQVIREARSKGVQLLGYIDTNFATVPLTTINQEIGDYQTWYGITGIYFDESSSGAVQLAYYQQATAAVRATEKDAVVMLNPGTYPDQSYMSLGDLINVFEQPYSAFVNDPPPQWVYDYPANMFSSQVSAVPGGDLPAAISLAEARHSGYIYLTDNADTSTLYEQLPTYWTTELQDIEASCASAGSDRFGYWLVASDGGIFSYGDATYYGSTGAIHLNKPVVGMASTPDGGGYWLVASDGGIFSFGDATYYGSTGAIHLNKPIVGMASTPDGGGYWLVASDGGIFSYGDATYYGSTGAIHLNKPIVGMASTPDGGGYWLVASDGGIFSFGDATFYGSTGAIHLNKPIVGMASTPDGGGYWLVASDGGIFSYGDATYYGSTGAIHLNKPVVGMASTPDGGGYWLVASDGGIFSYGDATYYGSTSDASLNSPVVAVSSR